MEIPGQLRGGKRTEVYSVNGERLDAVGSNLANAWVKNGQARWLSDKSIEITASEDDLDVLDVFVDKATQPTEETRAFAPTWKTRYSSITDFECQAYAAGIEIARDKVDNWLSIGDSKAPLPMEVGGVIIKTQADCREFTSGTFIRLVNSQSPAYKKRLNCELPQRNARRRNPPQKPKHEPRQVELTAKSKDQNGGCQYVNPTNGVRNCPWAALRGENFCLRHTPGAWEWLCDTPQPEGEHEFQEVADDGKEQPDT